MGYVRGHSHSQDSVVGYRVRLTIRDGEVLVPGTLVVVGTFGAGGYLDALGLALSHRTALYKTGERGRRVLSESDADRTVARGLPVGAYLRHLDHACVDPMYECGCVWGDDDYQPAVNPA